ncbi:IDEAL domain-containing protein [Bacillus sp. V59.32b]|uniref:IDEAL domain-containing protein n=1 Tax=Bacillus sp. V59.32b TaxID=1758642 RepID=UPI000E3CC223|nr:IDEAL domain-containing protein [Bacillus sp. V59.32b]RFU67571.1 IDEAL domain-containing protein [Bacillus sp. V59.32b]
MKNEKSYSELVKSYAMNKSKKDVYLKELLIDMIIHESVLTYKKTQLGRQIDEALDAKDKKQFDLLSNEWNEVNKMFGT